MSSEERPFEARPSRIGRASLLAGRETPVLAQRRSQRGPRPQEFFTESTNTSYIPSPSPTRSAAFAKTRQALSNNSRAGPSKAENKAAYHNNNNNKENATLQDTPVLFSERSASRGSSAKRSPVHISAEGSPQPSTRTAPSRSATRTPSPPPEEDRRPPLVSPASFVSESSEPPHALPEIYRRIEDEELIAGAGSDASSNATGSLYNHKVKRLSLSPAGPRSSSLRRLSPQLQAQETEVKVAAAPLPSRPTYSPPPLSPQSGASSPFEESVQTDPEMLARDERRVKEVLASDARPFTKARRPRADLTRENLSRQEGSDGSKGSSGPSSMPSSKSSEPGINVPQGWGGKARKDKRWLENIAKSRQPPQADPSTANTAGEPISQGANKAAKSVKDWLSRAATSPIAEVPEPLEDADTNKLSALRRKPSLEKARQWEAQTNSNTLSPPKTAAALAAVRERSMERLEKSAVATNRLGALGDRRTLSRFSKKVPDHNLGPSEEMQGADAPKEVNEPAPDPSNEGPSRLNVRMSNHESVQAPKVDKPDGPVSLEVATQLAFAAALQPNKQTDSRDLLRKFSRASSSSPGGNGRTSQAGSSRSDGSDNKRASPLSFEAGGASKGDKEANSVLNKPKPIATGNESDLRPVAIHDSETAAPQGESLTKPAREPVTQQDPPQASEQPSTSSRPDTKNPHIQTPKVVGGWIDTPVAIAKKLGMISEETSEPVQNKDHGDNRSTTRNTLNSAAAVSIGSRLKSRSKEELEVLATTAPDLSSALHEIVHHARRKNRGEEGPEGEETVQIDEDTIRSLEKLLADDDKALLNKSHKARETTAQPLSATDGAPGPPVGTVRGSAKTEATEPSKADYKSIMAETAKPKAQNRPLKAAQKSSNTDKKPDANPPSKGRSGQSGPKPALSVSIEDSPKQLAKKPKKSVAVIAPDEGCNQAGEFHDFIWPCEACRKRARAHVDTEDDKLGVVQWQTVQVPRLWYRKTSSSWPRPTLLTWIILIAWLVYSINDEVDSWYTPPFYAYKMKGFGVDYNMVRPPFVILKLIWRGPVGHFGRWIGGVLYALARFFVGIFGIDLDAVNAPPPSRPTNWIYYDVYEPDPHGASNFGRVERQVIR